MSEFFGKIETYGIEVIPNPGTLATDPIRIRYDLPKILHSVCEQLGMSPEEWFFISRFQGQMRPELNDAELSEIYAGDNRTANELSQMPGFGNYTTFTDWERYTDSLCIWAGHEAARMAVKSSDEHNEVRDRVVDWYVPKSIDFNRYLAKLDPNNPDGVILIPVEGSDTQKAA